jgi:hypothetical protein
VKMVDKRALAVNRVRPRTIGVLRLKDEIEISLAHIPELGKPILDVRARQPVGTIRTSIHDAVASVWRVRTRRGGAADFEVAIIHANVIGN